MFVTKLLQNPLTEVNSVRIARSLQQLSSSTNQIENISKTTKNVFEHISNPHKTSTSNFSISNSLDKKTFPLNFESPPLKRKPLLNFSKKPTRKSISTRNYLNNFGMIWNMNDRNSLLKSIVPNIVQKKDLSFLVPNSVTGVKRTLYTEYKSNDPCKEEKRKELCWRETCKPTPVMVLKNVKFKRLVKRYAEADRCDECCFQPEPCPPRADDQLIIKRKVLKPYEPIDCLPDWSALQKMYDDNTLNQPACIPLPPCEIPNSVTRREPCTPTPVLVLKNLKFKRLVKCYPKGYNSLIMKRKFVKPYEWDCLPSRSLNLKPGCKLIPPQKRYDDSKLDRPACISSPSCDDIPRADMYLKVKRKRLPRLTVCSACVPCAEPKGVKTCALKRPRKRQGWQDKTKRSCDKKNFCADAERLDDILCWKYVPKKLPLFMKRTDCVCKKEPEKEKPFQEKREGCYCDLTVKNV